MATQDEAAAVRRVNGKVLDGAREQLAEANAQVSQSAIVLGHLAQLRAVHNTDVAFATLISRFSQHLFRIGVGAAEAVTSVNKFGEGSSAYAKQAASAMATAAIGVNGAAKAVDEYLREIAGLTELINNEARDTILSAEAKMVLDQARRVAQTADTLRQQALEANVRGATARAEAAQQSAADSATKMQGLAARAEAAFQAAVKHQADLIQSSAKTSTDASAAMEQYVANALSAAGSLAMVNKVNTVANQGLTVRQITVDEGKQAHGAPADWETITQGLGLLGPGVIATLNLPDAKSPHGKTQADAGRTSDPENFYFFLVPSTQRYGFHLARAKSLAQKVAPDSSDATDDTSHLEAANQASPPSNTKKPAPPKAVCITVGKQDTSITASLFYTIDGKRLSAEDDGYVVFALRVRGPVANCTDADFSLASDLITPVHQLPALALALALASTSETTPANQSAKKASNASNAWFSIRATAQAPMPTHGVSVGLLCYLVRWDVYHALGDAAAATILQQPSSFAHAPQDTSGPSYQFDFLEGDPDAFGDLLEAGAHYTAFVYAIATPDTVKTHEQTHEQTQNTNALPTLEVKTSGAILSEPTLCLS